MGLVAVFFSFAGTMGFPPDGQVRICTSVACLLNSDSRYKMFIRT